MSAPRLTETGAQFTINPNDERSIPPYDPFRREHFWAVVMVYRWSPDARPNKFDHSTIAQISLPFCQYCQYDFEREFAKQPCMGPDA